MVSVTRPGYPFNSSLQEGVKAAKFNYVGNITYEALDGIKEKSYDTEVYFHQVANKIAEKAILEKISIIHAASNYHNAIPALIAARKLGIPFIYEVRGLWEYSRAAREKNWEMSDQFKIDCKLEAVVTNNADHIFTLTNALAEELFQRGCNKDNITLTPNAVDISEYKPVDKNSELKKKLCIDDGIFTFGYIGSILDYEGLDDLLHAFSNLLHKNINAMLVIVGDGISLEELKFIAHDLGIENKVIFTGKVKPSEVQDYYSIIDSIVLPRKPYKVCQLVSPLKPVEAMAMGVPLIVSDVSALKEMVEHEKTALVHKSNDRMSLTQTLLRMANNPSLRSELSINARKHVSQYRTWDAVADHISSTYASLT